MKVLTVNTVKISCAITEVYKFVVNMENFKQWFPEVIEIKSANSLEHGVVGKKYLETVKIPFKGEQTIPLEVVKSEENKLFVTEGAFYPLLPRMTVKFSEDDDNTTFIVWSMESRNENLIFRTLLLPLVRRIIKKRAEVGVQNLKEILENKN